MVQAEHLSQSEVFINNIVNFCLIVLSKTDPLDFSHDLEKEKSFFGNKEVFASLISESNVTYFKENISQMHYIVDFICLKHISKTSNGFIPYSFYNYDEMVKYLKYLQNEFTTEYNVSLPDYFGNIIQWIILRAEEFRSDAVHENNQIKTTKKIVTEFIENDFKKEIERLKNEINHSFFNASDNIKRVKDETNEQLIEIKNSLIKQNNEDLEEAVISIKNNTQKELHKSEKNMIQTSISILGVFSAVVLTFNMGISFAAEALQLFMQSSIYHSVLVILLFGFIIGNVIFALFAFLRHIHKQGEQPQQNGTNDTSDNGDKGDTKEKLSKSILGQIVMIFNIVLTILFVINVVCWIFGASEFRNEWVDNRVQECFSETDTTNINNV